MICLRGPTSRSGLQRLPQSLFQLPAIGSADSRPRTVFQDHFKFAMGDRLQAQDAFDIDDSRTMDADKTKRIEPLGKLAQRGLIEQGRHGSDRLFRNEPPQRSPHSHARDIRLLQGARSMADCKPKSKSRKTRSLRQSLVNHIPQRAVNHAMKSGRRWGRNTAG